MPKALKQVVHVPGDIRGGLLHFLNTSHSSLFICHVQPMQKVLGWKHLQGKDVSKCYKQAAGLSSMIKVQLERQLIQQFVLFSDSDAQQTITFRASVLKGKD